MSPLLSYVSFNNEMENIMISVTAYPTIEWIRNRACDRGAVLRSHARLPLTGSFSDRIVSQLRPLLQETVAVDHNIWVATPDGEIEVNLVLQKGQRKIAICLSARYGAESKHADALTMVYGGYDALYRVNSDRSDRALNDLIYSLMCDKPSWFSNYGRLVTGRKASEESILTSSIRASEAPIMLDLDHVYMERMKLCKANDWVIEFEKALNTTSGTQAA